MKCMAICHTGNNKTFIFSSEKSVGGREVPSLFNVINYERRSWFIFSFFDVITPPICQIFDTFSKPIRAVEGLTWNNTWRALLSTRMWTLKSRGSQTLASTSFNSVSVLSLKLHLQGYSIIYTAHKANKPRTQWPITLAL